MSVPIWEMTLEQLNDFDRRNSPTTGSTNGARPVFKRRRLKARSKKQALIFARANRAKSKSSRALVEI